MRCGIARRWVQEHLDVRKTSGDRRLQHFNSKAGARRCALAGVLELWRGGVCRGAGAAQPSCRAGGLATSCVGAGWTYQFGVFLSSMVLVMSSENSTKNPCVIVWIHVWHIGVYSQS